MRVLGVGIVAVLVLAGLSGVWAQSRNIEIRKGSDGADMVLVPAGEFWMGSKQQEVDHFVDGCTKAAPAAQCREWGAWEAPRHRLFLDGFYIDRYEVTNTQFARFVTATRHRTTAEREGWSWARQQKGSKWQWVKTQGAEWRQPNGPGTASDPNHPAVHVSWHDADAYCRLADKRLPTEAEWEKAARGPDGRRYPWGEDWDAANASGDMNVKSTTPAGRYPGGASPYGAQDMAGNVWEWVADWFGKDYYRQSPERNPQGPANGKLRVMRGGSWGSIANNLRTAGRNTDTPNYRESDLGFRCVKSLQ